MATAKRRGCMRADDADVRGRILRNLSPRPTRTSILGIGGRIQNSTRATDRTSIRRTTLATLQMTAGQIGNGSEDADCGRRRRARRDDGRRLPAARGFFSHHLRAGARLLPHRCRHHPQRQCHEGASPPRPRADGGGHRDQGELLCQPRLGHRRHHVQDRFRRRERGPVRRTLCQHPPRRPARGAGEGRGARLDRVQSSAGRARRDRATPSASCSRTERRWMPISSSAPTA